MKPWTAHALGILIALSGSTTLARAAAWEHEDLTSMREDFLAAEQALRDGALTRFRELRERLASYPLAPYLQYQYLTSRLSRVPAEEVRDFIARHEGSPLAVRLQSAWITRLARQGRWSLLIDSYIPGNSVTQSCLYRRALLKTGRMEAAFDGLERIWTVGFSQPRACDPLFKAWHREGHITAERAWRRFSLAMERNNTRLARYLLRFLPETERRWGELWLGVHGKPQKIKSTRYFRTAHPVREKILLHGARRLMRRDPLAAMEAWDHALKPNYPFSDHAIAAIERDLALALALRGLPEAQGRLAEIDPRAVDDSIREWRIRSAITRQNWYAVLAWIHQLPPDQQSTARWRYWKARALGALGQKAQAMDLYRSAAARRSYYGLLSSLRAGLPIEIRQQALRVERDDFLILEHHPGMLRARELFFLGRIVEARREWYHATRHMAEWQLQGAAKLAQGWGWHDRAIITMARTSQRDDLDLRFPLLHYDEITALARRHGIDPAFAFAIVRQESAFTPDARSHAGALGLMQLLPRTARQVARRMNVRLRHDRELLEIDTNLRLGMAHLRDMLSRYNNNRLLAAAAYNAGRYRVDKWIRQDAIIPADIWVETLPFRETRNYIQNVLLFTAIYEQKLGGSPPRMIRSSLHPISPAGAILALRAPAD